MVAFLLVSSTGVRVKNLNLKIAFNGFMLYRILQKSRRQLDFRASFSVGLRNVLTSFPLVNVLRCYSNHQSDVWDVKFHELRWYKVNQTVHLQMFRAQVQCNI